VEELGKNCGRTWEELGKNLGRTWEELGKKVKSILASPACATVLQISRKV
jgi:hypothetical protein